MILDYRHHKWDTDRDPDYCLRCGLHWRDVWDAETNCDFRLEKFEIPEPDVQIVCSHKFVLYIGLTKTYEFCKFCDEKREFTYETK